MDKFFWNLDYFNRHALTKLPQTIYLLRMAAESKGILVVHGAYCDGLSVGRKSGYNVAKIFGANYFTMLKALFNEGKISFATYDNETKNTLTKYIIPWYFSKSHDFDKTGFFPNLVDHVDENYLYEEIEKFIHSLISEPAGGDRGR